MASPSLVATVGGAVDPVVHALEELRPERVVFVVSRDTEAKLREVKSRTSTIPYLDAAIVLSDPEDLVRCLEEIDRELREMERRWPELAGDATVIDFTGGTKVMSVALVLATIERSRRFSYVGGTRRGGQGTGPVEPGAERRLEGPNPWDVLAMQLRPRIAEAFASARFGEAGRLAARAAERVGAHRRPFFEALDRLCEAYARWEAFEFRQALSALRRARHDLGLVAAGSPDPALGELVEALGREEARLAAIEGAHRRLASGGGLPGAEGARALLVDLVAQAERLARLAKRFDQAVAVLYGTVEKAAQLALLVGHGIDTGRVRPDQIPEPLRDEYCMRYTRGEGEPLRLPLFAAYRLLEALGDPLGLRFAARRDELRRLLDTRNGALVAHGWKPVRRETFEDLLDVTLDFLDLAREDLPELPRLPR